MNLFQLISEGALGASKPHNLIQAWLILRPVLIHRTGLREVNWALSNHVGCHSFLCIGVKDQILTARQPPFRFNYNVRLHYNVCHRLFELVLGQRPRLRLDLW